MPKEDDRTILKLFYVILIIITVTLFSTWCYQWIQYLLSVMFNVETPSTILDMLIGLIAMIASIFVFSASILAWRINNKAKILGIIGSIGFIIKNSLDSINEIVPLMKMANVTQAEITRTSWSIAGQLVQLAFWVIVLVIFYKTTKE